MNISNIKILVLILILTIVYFLFLHPISGMIGGLLYLIAGRIIPSIVNLLISFFIAFRL